MPSGTVTTAFVTELERPLLSDFLSLGSGRFPRRSDAERENIWHRKINGRAVAARVIRQLRDQQFACRACGASRTSVIWRVDIDEASLVCSDCAAGRRTREVVLPRGWRFYRSQWGVFLHRDSGHDAIAIRASRYDGIDAVSYNFTDYRRHLATDRQLGRARFNTFSEARRFLAQYTQGCTPQQFRELLQLDTRCNEWYLNRRCRLDPNHVRSDDSRHSWWSSTEPRIYWY